MRSNSTRKNSCIDWRWRAARREFVANFLWYTPDRYLYRHGRIMPSAMAFYNSHYASGTVLPTACQPRVGRGGRPESPEQARRRGLVDIALCRVLSDAGRRRGEAAALVRYDAAHWEDGSGRLRVGRSKTDAEARTVYLTPAAVAALDAMRPADVDGSASLFGLSAPSIARRGRGGRAGVGFLRPFGPRRHGKAHGRGRRADA